MSHEASNQEQAWLLYPFEAPPQTRRDGLPVTPEEFGELWRAGPFPGALRHGGDVLLDAPRYADSVIVSAAADVTEIGRGLGLEVVRASPCRPLPDMTW